jgi:hypothetical protein
LKDLKTWINNAFASKLLNAIEQIRLFLMKFDLDQCEDDELRNHILFCQHVKLYLWLKYVISTSCNDSVRVGFCHLEIESMSIRFLDDFDSIRFDSIRVFIDSKSLKKWSLKLRLLIVDIISNVANIHMIYFRRAFIISFLNNHILFICEKKYDYSKEYNIVRFSFRN